MCRKIRITIIVLTFAILCCCQKVYTRTWGGLMALAAEGEEEPVYREIKGYRLTYGEPDGNNGFYKSMPWFELTHQDEGLITKYRISAPDQEVTEGQLDMENTGLTWKAGMGDGTYDLAVWLEKAPVIEEPHIESQETEGEEPEDPDIKPPKYSEEELKKWEQKYSWKVDSTPPEIKFISPEGEGWFRQEVAVKVSARDAGSGVSGLHGGYGEEKFQTDGELIQFVVKSASIAGKPVGIWITAQDRAGNISKKEHSVYIDRTPPVLTVTGAEPYMISGKNLELTFTVEEENRCGEVEVTMEQEKPDGAENMTKLTGWRQQGRSYILLNSLEQDGIYRFTLTASDEAGNKAELYRQVIIDKTNPIIRCIELFHGKWMKEFCWNYDVAEVVEDFTTYTYHLELDGRLYTPGQRIFREGRHVLKLTARDAAGNEAFSSAEFMIDNTPPVIHYEEQEGQEKISDGQQFEKELSLQIRTENPQDRITEIRINGKRQKISDNSNVYRYSMDEEKPYEIVAFAEDKAGNTTEKAVGIQVVKEKSIAERVAGPIKQIFTRSQFEKGGNKEKEKHYGENRIGRAWSALATTIILCAGIAGTFRCVKMHRFHKTQKEPHKREDAG